MIQYLPINLCCHCWTRAKFSYLSDLVFPTYATDKASLNKSMYCRTWWRTPPEQWSWWHCCTQYRQAKFYCRDEPPWVTDLTSWHQPQKELSLWIEASKKCLKGPLTICTRSKPPQNIQPTTEPQKFCWYADRLVYFRDSYLHKC